MKQRLRWDEIIGILFWGVSIGMLVLSVYFCFSSDVWYDELFTMGLAGRSCGNLISITARDVHPPFYYLLVKLFLAGAGESSIARQVTAAKLVSCIPFLICILFSFDKIRKKFGMLPAGLFSFLILSMPQMAEYTVEIRMYGFALLFITTGMLYAYELLLSPQTISGWTRLTVCAVLACYTHYFACIAACMIYLYLLVGMLWQKKGKQMLRPYLLSGLICALLYAPWILGAVVEQVGKVRETYWIQPVSWRTLLGCVKFIFQPSFADGRVNIAAAVVFFLIYAAVLVFSVIAAIRKKENGERIFFAAGCIGILAGLLLFGILASVILRPIFVYRYILPAMGVFWLAFAVLLSGLKEKKAVLIPVLLFLAVIGIRNFRAFYGEEMWKKLQMEKALEELEQISSEDIIIYNFDQLQGVASYYLCNDTYLWYGSTEELIQEMYPGNHTLVEGEFTDEAGIARIKDFLREGKNIWFFGSGNARDEILEKWKQENINSEEAGSAMIERYWFNIYHITS